jgi:hypothetical protein
VPVAIADGALGLEALHTWTPPQGIVSGGIPTFTLNNRASLTALLTADGYAVTVKSITGLHSLPDLIDEREAALGRIGEVVYDAEDSGKTVVYSGTIYGSTLQKLREGSNAMRRTFQAKSREAGAVHRLAQVGEGMMTIAPHASYGTTQHVFFGRAQSLEMGDEQTAPPSSTYGPYLRPFVLTIRMADRQSRSSSCRVSSRPLPPSSPAAPTTCSPSRGSTGSPMASGSTSRPAARGSTRRGSR